MGNTVQKPEKISEKCAEQQQGEEEDEKYVQAKIEDYNLSEIKCPALGCDESLDPVMCSSFLTAGVFVRWCDVLCESTLSQYNSVYCPFRECSSLILNECGGKIKKTKCPNCRKLFCFECKVQWHNGYRCDKTMQLGDENDNLMHQVMKKQKWRRCPGCNHGVELISGCSHVKCRCGTTFCHACGRKRSNHWCWCMLMKPNLPCLCLRLVAVTLIILIFIPLFYFIVFWLHSIIGFIFIFLVLVLGVFAICAILH
ncbi:hypothetical protein AQUCO_01300923v1 [Aquilegia coerulea]|uniref:RBR-type E3 ubiquitin transferase n=1 Tax=Aquilegia coerulea TaxID=218851 RepID=A0A2G5E440_AQUCA|nr:hypothetical protein AQUCO_01300923v1 [Aquilegia coerulea]